MGLKTALKNSGGFYTSKAMPQKIKSAVLSMAKADFVFYVMPALMALLFAGTLAQAEIGLYAAHQKFFASFILWLGPVPLPGGYTLLSLLSINLTLKFLFLSDWSLKKSGIILCHLGALVLLIGGLLTALTATEKYMLIPEGDETPYIYDYHQRELMIYENETLKYTIPFQDIAAYKDKTLPLTLPFGITPVITCANCEILRREETENDDPNKTYQNMAAFMALKSKREDKAPEANLSGFEFELSKSENQNGRYLAFEGMPKPIEIIAGDKGYKIIFGKQQTALPFSIRLNDFQKETYAGTDKPKSYASDITILDEGAQWPARIEMNEPLRYKGYTFFQSSFNQTPDMEVTILSVVTNQGWLFPYIGTGILALGLLLHCGLTIRGRKTT